MAYFSLSSITGCTNTTGETFYEAKYNNSIISEVYKKDYMSNFIQYYSVVCVFGNNKTQFDFISKANRDTFYNSI
ncbi:hypothetical protein M0Q50_01830 [bacterium]|jgi:hypothetical protein|nr:hypothetical protein [bacterium]